MNDVLRQFSAEPPDFERRKTILFCPTCDRAAHIDDWPRLTRDARVRRLDCPDCGDAVWHGLDADEGKRPGRLPTPTA
ncbi:hypothetical protein C440_03353 [Haloferax mucosum ATCC BAA-1512]|uniref:DUF8106 domain-containing protein n=1 Tax=Haloferax mucosum ATCC BAA-1512 TaxID=662479 RepID=M0ILP4_9EURY|nr:hypothetical protein [Haloferax mucosum]ELZ96778.1 hypothetical protein C440_03353 [Haloferax mucosum ATCC BAA-1512]